MAKPRLLKPVTLQRMIAEEIPLAAWPTWAQYVHVASGTHTHHLFVDLCQHSAAELTTPYGERKRIGLPISAPYILHADFSDSRQSLFGADELKISDDMRDVGKPGVIVSTDTLAPSVDRGEKYRRDIKGVCVDVYDVLNAFGVTCSAAQHAIKKLLMPGARGGKSRLKDLQEAGVSVQRAVEFEQEREKTLPYPETLNKK